MSLNPLQLLQKTMRLHNLAHHSIDTMHTEPSKLANSNFCKGTEGGLFRADALHYRNIAALSKHRNVAQYHLMSNTPTWLKIDFHSVTCVVRI